VPVGAAPERGEASRDLLIANEVEQRGLLERFKTRRTVPRIVGEFSLSAGLFSQNRQRARAGYPRGLPCVCVDRALLGCGGEVWATLAK
jgi:hypothetical protein